MKLILAEKPSVAKTLASFLGANKRNDGYFEGNGYIVTYAIGHLVSLYDTKDYDKSYSGSWKINNFPFIPDKFRFKVESSKLKQFNIVRDLLHRDNIELIINATDNDREGELISFLIFLLAKNKKPIKRILVNEWTPEDINRGLSNLKDDIDMRNLQAAGYTRLVIDWLIGINFTSAATLKYGNGKLLNIGRVILPTVKLVYDRDMEIKNFIPQTYFELHGTFIALNGKYIGKYIKNKDSKFSNKKDIQKILDDIQNKKGLIKDKKVSKSKEYAPKLFSLTSLQGYITSKHNGWTSDKVLKVCQSLYEGKGSGGYITYPRTDSVYLEESLVDKVSQTLNKLKKGLTYEDKIKFTKTKRIFDSSKVDSHSAIIPTYIVPNKLTPDEELVYKAIKDRFIANFMPPAEYENTEIITDINNHIFITKGKVLKSKGYLEVYGKEEGDELLPNVDINEEVDVEKLEIVEKQTTPPKPYTEDTLLKAMKNCGKNIPEDDTTVLSGYSIGTSATRADVLKKILDVGYVNKKGKSYSITDLGINLVEIFPIKELLDVDYTGKLEKSLSDIQRGQYTKSEYLKNMIDFVLNGVEVIKNDSNKSINTTIYKYNSSTKSYDKSNDTESLGKCPVCKSDVVEISKGFICKNYKECKFGIWNEDRFLKALKKKPNKTMVKSILKNGKANVKGLTSKKGNKFDAILKYEKKENGYWGWDMAFEDSKNKEKEK